MICRLEFRMKLLHCLVVLIFLYLVQCNSAARFSVKKKLKIQNLLKRLNKQPHKSIKSPDGDIIDCIPISHQPAFHHPLLQNHKIQHAIAYVDGDKYFGAQANINVWQPKVQEPTEFSLSQIWVTKGSFDAGDLNSVEAGWMVSEDLYGDNNTRLFTFWTRDAYKSTGCYNLLCSGFIQISQQMALGASISPVSSYNGAQYDISILIWKDPDGGNWWMKLLNINEVIGYWPASLFTNLADGADMIQWGGEAVNLASGGQHTTTQMGSGHFPGEGFNKASYFKNIQVVDGSNQLKDPDDVKTFTDQSSCYDVQNGKNGQWGTYFYYGGPGRNPKCP
ncbi:protein neprosin-like isoform X2 [Apium graveolens]|uniref:protein neprosin-like isoform X2 n=1 Tax=Apium graveolens TaxID=4045 RepID=UPI003D7A1572